MNNNNGGDKWKSKNRLRVIHGGKSDTPDKVKEQVGEIIYLGEIKKEKEKGIRRKEIKNKSRELANDLYSFLSGEIVLELGELHIKEELRREENMKYIFWMRDVWAELGEIFSHINVEEFKKISQEEQEERIENFNAFMEKIEKKDDEDIVKQIIKNIWDTYRYTIITGLSDTSFGDFDREKFLKKIDGKSDKEIKENLLKMISSNLIITLNLFKKSKILENFRFLKHSRYGIIIYDGDVTVISSMTTEKDKNSKNKFRFTSILDISSEKLPRITIG